MYPESLLWWIGGTAILLGLLGLIGMGVWLLEQWLRKRKDEEGRSAVWYVFEVLSAVFVVTGLLVAIYSDSQVARAVAGIGMIVVVSAATASILSRGNEEE